MLNFVREGRELSVKWEGNKYFFITTKSMPSGEKAKNENNSRTAIGFGRNNEIIEISKENLDMWTNGKHVKVGFGECEIVEEVKEKDLTQAELLGVSKKQIGFTAKDLTEEQVKLAVENKLFMTQNALRPMVTGFRSTVQAMADLNGISEEEVRKSGITDEKVTLAVPKGMSAPKRAIGFGKTKQDPVPMMELKAVFMEYAEKQASMAITEAIKKGSLPKDLKQEELVKLTKEFSDGYARFNGVNPEPEKSNMVAGFAREVSEGTKTELPKHVEVKGFVIPSKEETVEENLVEKVAVKLDPKKVAIIKNRSAFRKDASAKHQKDSKIINKKISDAKGR